MNKILFKNKVEGCLYIASFLETFGYFNSKWEFNYGNKIDTINEGNIMNYFFIYHYTMLGGIDKIDITTLNSSDDTILLLATCEAVNNGGGEINYINSYLKYYELLKDNKRSSGNATLSSLEKIRLTKSIKSIEYSTSHGGNGCAIRTAPIGLKYYEDYDKVCEEALIASLVTHNYPIGYLGGIISALFTAYAINNINPFEWSKNLIKLYKKNFFIKLISKYSKKNVEIEINDYFLWWEKYNELRLSKMKYRNLPIFINPKNKFEDLLNYTPIKYHNKMRGYENIGMTGLESVIIAYDNLLLSTIPDNKNNLNIDINNPEFNWYTLFFNNVFFFGDNDSIGAISGAWYGALLGIDKFPLDKIKELEFYQELKKNVELF
jgi:ADP-ribosylarginine hydrolase